MKNKKSDDKIKKKPTFASLYPSMSMKEKYLHYDIKKIGYLDIETTGFDAEFQFMLSWAMYVRDVENPKKNYLVWDVLSMDEIMGKIKAGKIDLDKPLLETLFKEMKDVDYLVGHYFAGWNKFDMPFIRARAAMNKMKYPFKHKQKRYADTWKMSHMLYKIHAYRLDAVGHLFGIKTKKTIVDSKKWFQAKFGYKPAMKYVLDHNKKDAKITHDVHKEMEEFMPISAGYI